MREEALKLLPVFYLQCSLKPLIIMIHNVIKFKIILCFIILMISCNSTQKEKIFNNFPEEIDLKAKIIDSKGVVNVYGTIGIQDSIMIITNYNDSHILYFIDKYDFSPQKKVIKRGRGPYEVPSLLRGAHLNDINDEFYYNSGAKHTIYKFSIPPSIKDTINILEFMKYKNSPEIFEMEIIDDSLLCYVGSRDYSAMLVNKKGEIIKNIGKLPDKPEGIKEANYNNMYTRFISFNSLKKQIVIGFYKIDKLISFDLEGNKVFEKIGPDNIETSYKNQYQHNAKKAYYSIKSDGNYIYGLYSGRKSYIFNSKAITFDNIKHLYSKSILIFDWEGNPKLRVNLSHECRDFIIDKETNRLITLSLEEEPFHVYDFSKIKQVLN